MALCPPRSRYLIVAAISFTGTLLTDAKETSQRRTAYGRLAVVAEHDRRAMLTGFRPRLARDADADFNTTWMLEKNSSRSHQTERMSNCANRKSKICTCVSTGAQSFEVCECTEESETRCWFVGDECFCRFVLFKLFCTCNHSRPVNTEQFLTESFPGRSRERDGVLGEQLGPARGVNVIITALCAMQPPSGHGKAVRPSNA